MSTTNLQEALVAIQSEMKAPKSQFNEFGGYKFRSAEDILDAAKPFIKEHKCILLLSDEVIVLMDRFYIKAAASLSRGSESITVHGYARETEHKKGMDEAQVTGSASSYARKYALNGLFCLSDVQDADSHDNREHQPQSRPQQKPPQQSNGNAPVIKVTDVVGFGKKYKDTPWKDVPDSYLEYVKNNTREDHIRDFVTQQLNIRQGQREKASGDGGNGVNATAEDFARELKTIEQRFREQDGLAAFAKYCQETFGTTDMKKVAEKELVFRVQIIEDLRNFFKLEFPDWEQDQS